MSSADPPTGYPSAPEPVVGESAPMPIPSEQGFAWDATPPEAPGVAVEERPGEAPPINAPISEQPEAALTLPPRVPYTPEQGLARAIVLAPGTGFVCAEDDDEKPAGWMVSAPPYLISSIAHMLLLILLGLWLFAPEADDQIRVVLSTSEGDPQEEELEGIEIADDPLEEFTAPALEEQDVPELEEPLPTSEIPLPEFDAPGVATNSNEKRPNVSRMLSGRSESMKQANLELYGGTAETEAAVLEGLRWLSRTQDRRSGEWKLTNTSRNEAAATSMALLAFLGAGHTDRKGDFQRQVDRGFRALLKMQQPSGQFPAMNAGRNHTFYTHALCTIAVCEMYALTGDLKYLAAAERAIAYAVQTQSSEGGWKYHPGKGADLSVTGWMMMALQSARMAGLDVPDKSLDGIEGFLDKVQRSGGDYYTYEIRPGSHTSPALDAVGLLGRQYFGAKRDDPQVLRVIDRLMRDHPLSYKAGNAERAGHDVYYWYYLAQVAHHVGGERWRRWNEVMRVEVPKHQVTAHGRNKGSWDPADDRWGITSGRHYVTCLSIYLLEVYYRHLPLYSMGG
ncbi:MAG: squalene--hopene cyclase [Pirellulales bacterium]|nr:squalene--hopene cyclase [Pirellulales bacterium]